jgi:hypothetical protein
MHMIRNDRKTKIAASVRKATEPADESEHKNAILKIRRKEIYGISQSEASQVDTVAHGSRSSHAV